MKNLLIGTIMLVYLLITFTIFKYDLAVVCNEEETYCSGIFSETISMGLPEEEYLMYSTLKNPSVFYFYKLLFTDPKFVAQNVFTKLGILLLLYFPYYFYTILSRKIEKRVKETTNDYNL